MAPERAALFCGVGGSGSAGMVVRMSICAHCKWAKWQTGNDGRLDPRGAGECTYRYPYAPVSAVQRIMGHSPGAQPISDKEIMMLGNLWTDDQIAELTRFVATGLSASQIGRIMGVTRNAIIGKVGRLGLRFRLSPGVQKKERSMEPLPKPAPPDVAEPLPSGEPQEPKGCRFIYGDVGEDGWRFCQRAQVPHKAGVHKGSKSRWCEGHYREVYIGVPKSRVPAPMPGRLPLRVLDVVTVFDE